MLKKIFKKYFIFIFLVVLISYGQISAMYVWQDDNALFFKLANIAGPAGYLGKGLIGEYIYKYTAFFYYPIYLLFQHNTVAYFVYSIFFYFLASISVYLCARKILGEPAGKVSGFLFAAGYIASDGFIRLYISVPTSISIILVSFLIYSYFEFRRSKSIKYYLFAVASYFLAIELVMSRTTYLLLIPVLFEVIFLLSKKSFLRLVPFVYIYYLHFLNPPDPRSGGFTQTIESLISGNVAVLSGFMSSISNLVVPDWVVRPVGVSIFLGVLVLISCIIFFVIQKSESRKIFLFFAGIAIANVFLYSSYNPDLVHESYHRYLAHSFLVLTFLFGFLYNKLGKFKYLILVWGIGNLIASVFYQQKILLTRTAPAKQFYNQLKSYVPEVNKGDIFYFDVAEGAHAYFGESFSVAQMPEETAIAWRYGIDRYDIKMCTTFKCLSDLVDMQKIDVTNLHTFLYTKSGLIDTTNMFRKSLLSQQNKNLDFEKQEKSEFKISKPIESLTPLKFSAYILSRPTLPNKFETEVNNNFYSDPNLQQLAFSYKKVKNEIINLAKVDTSSNWQDRIEDNLMDGNSESLWESDRLAWPTDKAWLTIEQKTNYKISSIAWINGYPDHSPTSFKIEASNDGKNWSLVSEESNSARLSHSIIQVARFKPINYKYFRVNFLGTINNDSPTISEIWLVPEKFNNLDINKVEEFLSSPLKYVQNEESFYSTIKYMGYSGKVQVYWMNEKSDKWQTDFSSSFSTFYNGVSKRVEFKIPAGGIYISKLKFVGIDIPGDFEVNYMTVSN